MRHPYAPRKAANLAALPARIPGFARVGRRTRQNTGFARAKRGGTESHCAPAAAAQRAFRHRATAAMPARRVWRTRDSSSFNRASQEHL